MLSKRQFVMIFVALTFYVSPLVHAQGIGTTYDMSRFLSEPHPFATGSGVRWQPLSATPTASVLRRPLPARAPTPRAQPRETPRASTQTKAEPSNRAKTSGFYDGWLSEVRVGILKHAVSLVGNTTKETGVDGNLEILFGLTPPKN